VAYTTQDALQRASVKLLVVNDEDGRLSQRGALP
jgi:hypothetical protein